MNITSIAGSRVHPFAGSAYATSKAALAALTREMAADFGPYGIRVNAVAPGWIRTEMTQALRDNETANQHLMDRTPLGRWGDPEEMGDVALFLASPMASYVTGQMLLADGGITLM